MSPQGDWWFPASSHITQRLLHSAFQDPRLSWSRSTCIDTWHRWCMWTEYHVRFVSAIGIYLDYAILWGQHTRARTIIKSSLLALVKMFLPWANDCDVLKESASKGKFMRIGYASRTYNLNAATTIANPYHVHISGAMPVLSIAILANPLTETVASFPTTRTTAVDWASARQSPRNTSRINYVRRLPWDWHYLMQSVEKIFGILFYRHKTCPQHWLAVSRVLIDYSSHTEV